MFWMGQRLKLSHLFCVQTDKAFFRHGFLQNARQKLRLRAKLFGLQARNFTRLLQGGEIDMRRQILPAGTGQKVIGHMLPLIGAQRAASACRLKHFFRRKAIINRQQPAVRQYPGRFAPPVFCGRAGFNRVIVRQNTFQFRRAKARDT